MANAGTFKKGQKRPNQGRPKGLPNKATQNAREAIARFVDGNTHRLQGWLDQIAEQEGPKEAFKCFADVIEYHVPKLQRTEMTATLELKKAAEMSDDQLALIANGSNQP